MTEKTAVDYRTSKPHPIDETAKPEWATGPDGRFTKIADDFRFSQLFQEWLDDACTHPRTGIIHWVNGGSQTCYNWFCAHCGFKLGSNIPHELALAYGPVDASLDDMATRSKVYVAQRQERLEQIKANCAGPAQVANRESNDDYLRSPQWRALRSKVLSRARGLCEACLEASAAEVHHLTYEHYGHELAWELRAVCVSCHERVHHRQQEAAE